VVTKKSLSSEFIQAPPRLLPCKPWPENAHRGGCLVWRAPTLPALPAQAFQSACRRMKGWAACDTAERPQSTDKLAWRGAVARGCSHGIRDNSGVSGRRGGGGFWNGHFHRLRDRTVRRVGDVVASNPLRTPHPEVSRSVHYRRRTATNSPTEFGDRGQGADPAPRPVGAVVRLRSIFTNHFCSASVRKWPRPCENRSTSLHSGRDGAFRAR
jgi:hypothetical protein